MAASRLSLRASTARRTARALFCSPGLTLPRHPKLLLDRRLRRGTAVRTRRSMAPRTSASTCRAHAVSPLPPPDSRRALDRPNQRGGLIALIASQEGASGRLLSLSTRSVGLTTSLL